MTERTALDSAHRLAAGLLQRGLDRVVVSPGSRNAPLLQAFESLGIRSVVALDERAAAHHALGLSLASGQPVAVCCTSGTAALNHGPALAEADRVGLPLISLTADRPSGADDHWESQTLRQQGVHAPHVRGSFQWAGEEAHEAELLDAMSDALQSGPVHINCPFDEPLYPAEEGRAGKTAPAAAPASTPAAQSPDLTAFLNRLRLAVQQKERILLLGGTQPHPLSAEELHHWTRFGVVAGDSPSGLGIAPDTVVATDRWMKRWGASGEAWEAVHPDLVVTFGAPLLSKSLRQALRQAPVDAIHIDPGVRFPHAFGTPPLAVQAPVHVALAAAASVLQDAPIPDGVLDWKGRWSRTEAHARAGHGPAVEAAPWSDLRAHALLHAALPASGWDLHLGNSTPVRYAQLFHRTDAPAPWSNRGVAGIDGCSATAVGAALAERKVTLITGDLGFLYDANAFHVHPLPSSLRIAVLNNSGGGVFRWLDGPQRTGLLESHFEMRHGVELRALCDLHGLEHQRVTNAEGLQLALADWWSDSDVPRVLEIATPPEVSAEAYKAYMAAVSV